MTIPLLAFRAFSYILIYAICRLNNCVCSVVHVARVHANPLQLMMAVFLEARLPCGILDAWNEILSFRWWIWVANESVCVCVLFLWHLVTPCLLSSCILGVGIAMQCRQYISLLIVQFVCRLTTTKLPDHFFFFCGQFCRMFATAMCILLGYITFLIRTTYRACQSPLFLTSVTVYQPKIVWHNVTLRSRCSLREQVRTESVRGNKTVLSVSGR